MHVLVLPRPITHVAQVSHTQQSCQYDLPCRLDPNGRNTTALVVRHPGLDASRRSTHAADFEPLTTLSVVYSLARALDLLVKLLPELLFEFVDRSDL